jgi:hypothetical protein
MRKTYLFAGLVLLVAAIFAGCTGGPEETAAPAVTAAPTTAAPATTAAPVALPTYSGTLYVAGHGGHFAVAKVAIDPSDTTNPITVKKLSKYDLAPLETSPSTHKTHDARIDYGTDNMYWSTYMPDELTEEGKKLLHVGITDLADGSVINDIAFEVPAGTDTKPWYCGSGQSDTKFIPVSMSIKGYVDVWDKAKLATGSVEADALDHRVWLDGKQGNADFGTDYKFYHGTNTPDGSKFLLSANRIGADGFTGNIDLYYLDMADLENGVVNVLQENRITGTVGKTITFRQYFTNDGTKLLQSGADSVYLIDANTLEVLDQEMNVGGAVHDAMPTPDDKYGIITVRVADAEGMSLDGQVQLYDIENMEIIGEPASVCAMCHPDGTKLILCGLDGILTVD